jgi:hypothetical protein
MTIPFSRGVYESILELTTSILDDGFPLSEMSYVLGTIAFAWLTSRTPDRLRLISAK